jgi:prophage regulatory protein
MVQQMLRLREVLRLRGRSKSAHYADVRAGRFPPGIKIGPRVVAWPTSDLEAEQKALLAARDAADTPAA